MPIKIKKLAVKVFGVISTTVPLMLFAEPSNLGYFTGGGTDIGLIAKLYAVVNALIPFLIGLAVLVFIWGVVKYVTSGGDEEKRKEGQSFMVWGIIGIFVMVAVWGFVAFIATLTGINPNTLPYGGPGIPTER